jgi:8-oxo-dGTP pyrophosphatase MutT (NUDIX family)
MVLLEVDRSAMLEDVLDHTVPRIPVSAGALLWDGHGRFLILKPTYKAGWTVPGGQIEKFGESPWQGCQREVFEETGLEILGGRLICIDFRPPKSPRPDGSERPGGLRLLFDCGVVDSSPRRPMVLDGQEIEDHRWVEPDEAEDLLSRPVRRRVRHAVAVMAAGGGAIYLEDGRPVAGVG